MADIISKDDEEARKREQEREKIQKEEQDKQKELEREREKIRKEEQDKQKELELAQEKGRKKGLEEQRNREKHGLGTGIKIVIALIVLALIVGLAAFLTLNITITPVSQETSLPFTVNYAVSFPEGQTITIGNTHVTVLSYQNQLISDIDGDRQNLVVGEDRVIPERRAVVKTLGVITLIDTNFRINLTYQGAENNRAYFNMAVHSSRQVSDLLLKQLLPPEIDARPV